MVKYMDKENVQGSITSDNQTSSYTMPWCIPLFATITASRNRSGLNKLFQLLRKVIVGVIIIPSVLHTMLTNTSMHSLLKTEQTEKNSSYEHTCQSCPSSLLFSLISSQLPFSNSSNSSSSSRNSKTVLLLSSVALDIMGNK